MGHCFLRTMAAAHHSTRTSFFRCLSPFQETGLLEPTPYNKRSSSSFHSYPLLSLSFSISDIPALFSSALIARAVSRILHEYPIENRLNRVVSSGWFTPTGNRRPWFRFISRMSSEREKNWLDIDSLSFSLSLVDTTKEFHGLVAVEINELYLVVAQIFNRSIDTYRFLWPWIIYIYINATWTYIGQPWFNFRPIFFLTKYCTVENFE